MNAQQAVPFTTGSVLREMTDLSVLAEFPDPPYKTVQFSSYDRRSVAPYAPDWYANSDGFGREPIPGFLKTLQEPGEDKVGKYLLAQVDGPGVICRTWTAAINGEVKVVLDGQAAPLYEGSANDFLGHTHSALAQKAGLITEPIGAGFRQAEACYFPVPFAKSLRVEWRGRLDQLHFYHLEVRRYPAGTPITTFSLADLTTYATDIARTLRVLQAPNANWRAPIAGQVEPFELTVAPGAQESSEEAPGPGAIQEIRLKVEAGELHRALRQVIVKGFFEGAPQPQVEAPIGDLFGSGPGVSPFDSLPTSVLPDGTMVCRFLMPFRTSARFVLDNRGDQTIRVAGQVALQSYNWREGTSMHFHAKWRVDHGLLAGGGADSFDLPYLCARGKGVFVGAACMLLNPTGVPTSGGNWWGEGDEKIWVDDDTFPSLFGTGSEDYYNYAWSRPDLFSFAYCAQPLDTGPDNRGFVANIRWQILDALPFESSLDFYMELMHHSRTPDLSYARLACFYALPSVREDHLPITTADVTQGLALPDNWQPVAAGAARGATFYQAEDLLVDTPANVEIVSGRMWSAGKLVRWTPKTEGESTQLRLNLAKAGRYQLVATAAFTPASGRFTAKIDDDTDLSPVADLFTPHHTMLRNLFFSAGDQHAVDLTAGEHTITLTARGKNEASRGMEIGVDFVWLLAR